MKYIVFYITLIALLSGCATTPTQISDAKMISPDRIYDFGSSSDLRTGHLVIIRDTGLTGSGCYLALYINGTLAARVDPKERVDLYVEPGEILLKVGIDPMGRGLCALGSHDVWTQRETYISVGATKYFRMTITEGGTLDIFRTDA